MDGVWPPRQIENPMTLFVECDACKLAHTITPKVTLCSGCLRNKAIIDVAARQIESLENIVAALAAFLAYGARTTGDGPFAKRVAKLLAGLTQLQSRTHNTGLTDDVQAIIDEIVP